MQHPPTVSEAYRALELALDDYDEGVRSEALRELCRRTEQDGVRRPTSDTLVNLHAHTFFSYNPYGYSPSRFAWLARWAGFEVAGMVDFDVLDGLEEFFEAGRLLRLKTCVSLESRVYVPEFADRVTNSPGEPGIAYFLGVGFTTSSLEGDTKMFLEGMRRRAERRNRELVDRVNRFLVPVVLDYDRDVLPLTPRGNATERHLCVAYARKATEQFSSKVDLSEYWCDRLGDSAKDLDFPDGPALQAAIRARTMKKDGAGYIQPNQGSFPQLTDMSRFILDAGAIPTLGWVDGTSEGEQAIEELLDTGMAAGAAALLIIPARNFTPGKKDEKLRNLYDVVALAEQRGLPVAVGTEMNSPGQRFADDFESEELKPLVPVFLKGAHILYAHTVLQRQAKMGYLGDWATRRFSDTKEKNEFFRQFGSRLAPEQEPSLTSLHTGLAPDEVLGLLA